MGQRGPLPKRDAERTRTNSTFEDGIALKKGVALPYEWREPDPDWDPKIIDYYNSFRESGMAAFYQSTDVATIWLACEIYSRQFATGRPSAMMWAEASKMMAGIGATEGERRRMHIELEAEKEEGPDLKVVAMDSARERLQNSAKE